MFKKFQNVFSSARDDNEEEGEDGLILNLLNSQEKAKKNVKKEKNKKNTIINNTSQKEVKKSEKPKKPEKTKEDIFFDAIVIRLSGEKEITEEEEKEALKLCETHEGRKGFLNSLNFYRSKANITNKKKFETIVNLIRRCVNLSYEKNDPDTLKPIINMCSTYFFDEQNNKKEESQLFILRAIKDEKIFQEQRFWETVFYEIMGDNRDKSFYMINDKRYSSLKSDEKDMVEIEMKNFTYSSISCLVFSMLEVGTPTKIIRSFIEKMTRLNNLEKNLVSMIKTTFPQVYDDK